MAINNNADDMFFMRHPEQRALALALDEGFDVNFGSPLNDLFYWIAYPKTSLQERFGFSKEILVIYSPHANTDARVLTAVEKITRFPDIKNRLDPAIIIVIHPDSEDYANTFFGTHPDWIFICFQIAALHNPQRGNVFIRTQIAKRIGEVDLFGMTGPINRNAYFFGRDDLVQQLAVQLTERTQNAGLFGLRKTGKTSVLFALRRRFEKQRILVEYIDCHSPGIHAARWWHVVGDIARRLALTCFQETKNRIKVTIDVTERTAGSILREVIRNIRATGRYDKVLLFFDEVEYITPFVANRLGMHWDDDFNPLWQTIRSLYQEDPSLLAFVIAGVNPVATVSSHFKGLPNPIFQLAQPIYLAPFGAERIREMVKTLGRFSGVRFSDDVYAYLSRKYGGHPYLTRIACSEACIAATRTGVDYLPTIQVKDFHDISHKIDARLQPPIKDILLSLVWWYPEEYDLLRILADGDDAFVEEYLVQKRDSLFQFAKYGLLTDNGKHFAIEDVKSFLSTEGSKYKELINPFTRGDIPQELLPEVPDLESLSKLFDLRVEIESTLRRAIIMYLGVTCNFDDTLVAERISRGLGPRVGRPNPTTLFSGRKPQEAINEVFTTDLKTIITANWDVFGKLFEENRARFEMNMDTINRARKIEAHTKPFTTEELREFTNSYEWMRARLVNIPK